MNEFIILLIIVGSVTCATLFVAWFEKWTTKLIKKYLEGDTE